MMKATFFLSWPGTYLKEIGMCAGIGLALLIANIFWQPAVEPIMPAELTVATPGKPVSPSMTEEESLDFIFRPLFSTSRRPIGPPAPEVVVVPKPDQQSVDRRLLEGHQLLGVFSSGDRGGVILLDPAQERVRLYIGDSIGGWVLQSTDLRSAHFVDAAGGTASLELAMASSLPMPQSVAVSPRREPATSVNTTGKGEGDNPSPPAYDGAVTFESIARRQKQEMEAQANDRNP
jgi:hypothetical protein